MMINKNFFYSFLLLIGAMQPLQAMDIGEEKNLKRTYLDFLQTDHKQQESVPDRKRIKQQASPTITRISTQQDFDTFRMLYQGQIIAF